MSIPEHRAVPHDDERGALRCAVCGGAVRTADRIHFIHAEPRPINVPEPGYPKITESEQRALWGDR